MNREVGITLAASGTGVTATTGANLVSRNFTPKVTVSFTAGASDAATVQNAIAAIRASPAMLGMLFIPTPPTYGATINTSNVLSVWANTLPTCNAAGGGLFISVTGTGATVGAPNGSFMTGTNATPNGFSI